MLLSGWIWAQTVYGRDKQMRSADSGESLRDLRVLSVTQVVE